MSLFKTFGEIFDPKQDCEYYTKKFYDNWIILLHLTPEDEMFTIYIDLVDSEMDYLRNEFNYIAPWKSYYDKFCDKYFDSMKFKVTDKSGLIPSNHFTLNLN